MGEHMRSLTVQVRVSEVFRVRPAFYPYSDSLDRQRFGNQAATTADESMPWRLSHNTYDAAVDAGMLMLAKFPTLVGFSVDKTFEKVQDDDAGDED